MVHITDKVKGQLYMKNGSDLLDYAAVVTGTLRVINFNFLSTHPSSVSKQPVVDPHFFPGL